MMVLQEKLKGKQANAVCGTLKLVVLKGDSKSRDLVVISNYEQKPFYMVSHIIPTVIWVEK